MSDDSIKKISSKLRSARQAKGLTQAEVAKKAGISETHYAQIERSEKNPSTSIFLDIINAIGVGSKEILGQ